MRRSDPVSVEKRRVREQWRAMIRRCSDPRDPDFANYGGRGIRVCDAWSIRRGPGSRSAPGLEAFIRDMGARPSARHQIDRSNNNGPYSPENCRWSTPRENASNRRTTLHMDVAGGVPLAVLADVFDIAYATLYRRVSAGWSPECALTTPVARRAS